MTEDRGTSANGSAHRLVRAARAAKELCDVLWETLDEHLREPDLARIEELSKRLSDVSGTLGVLAQASTPDPPDRHTPPEPSDRRTQPQPVREETVEDRAAPELRLAPPMPYEPRATHTRLVDEHATPSSRERLAPVDAPATIEVRDVRHEEGPSAWVSSVGRLLERHAVDRLPFAVLLIEIVDVARLERSETPHGLHDIVRQIEAALGQGMRVTDELSRETLGRYWLAAPDTDTAGARVLAERLAQLVHNTTSHRGVPLEVAIGIAVCPYDGADAPALAARADLGVYSARATGRSVAHTDMPPS